LLLLIWVLRYSLPADTDPWAVPPQPATAKAVVELNTADEQSLMALPCIGAVRAQEIVAHRVRQGWFRSAEELFHLPGLSACRQRLAGRIRVDADTLAILLATHITLVHTPPRNLNTAVP